MTIIRNLRVNGALHEQVVAPEFDAKLKRYVATVKHADGKEQKVYSRLPGGPFVFHVPSTENPHP